MPFIGSSPYEGKQWSPQLKISGMNAPAEQWIVDPTLPPLGTDPNYPTTDHIVIPRGRITAIRRDTTSYTGRAVLTIADGASNKVAGYAQNNVLRQWQDRVQFAPVMFRQDLIEVPYVSAINGAYGALGGGDKVTAYWGSLTSTTNQVANDKGKIVKWVEKKVYNATSAASTIFQLSSANYPGFTPRLISAYNTNGAVTSLSGATLAWNNTFGCWTATLGSSAISVYYDFGQAADQIAGECVRVEPISASHELQGWLKWVNDNYLAWEYPPMLQRVPVTAVTGETPTTVVSGSQYRLANKPMATWVSAKVYVTGTLYAPDGTSTTLTATEMSRADVPFTDYTLGQYYNINPLTGDIYFSSNVTVSSVTVDYSYETSYRQGRLFNGGIQGQTDGVFTGVPGTPTNLEISGSVGSLRCIIY